MLTCLEWTAFRKHCGKSRISNYEQFLTLPQCFQLFSIIIFLVENIDLIFCLDIFWSSLLYGFMQNSCYYILNKLVVLIKKIPVSWWCCLNWIVLEPNLTVSHESLVLYVGKDQNRFSWNVLYTIKNKAIFIVAYIFHK